MPGAMKLAEALNVVRRQGRYGDSELAHVNPREAAILRAMGGSGTVNPRTGMREYSEDPAAQLAEVDTSDGEGAGMGAAPSPTTPQGSEPSFGERASGAIGRFINSLNAPAPIYTTPGMMTAAAGFLGRNVTPALESFLGPARFGATSEPQLPGIAGDFPGTNDTNQPEDRGMMMAQAAAAPAIARPQLSGIPGELSSYLSRGMSPLQQRSAIGTFGTQGVNPAFRTEDARRYYASLLAQELVNPAGGINEQAYMLPVEQQYLGSVFGRQASTPSQAYEAIRGSL